MLSKKERTAGKYDFARVDVNVDSENSYVLSRYILARILTSLGIDYRESSQIAFDLKKRYVDLNQLVVSHEEVINQVVEILKNRGRGDKMIRRFHLMSKFNQSRIPIMVLFFGSGSSGKATIASRLSEIINISTLISSELIFELYNIQDPSFKPSWNRSFENKDEFLKDYMGQCTLIRKGLEGDIKKCFENGKSIIIYGNDMNPVHFEDVVKKYRITKETIKVEGKGIILPFFIKSDDEKIYNRFFEKYCGRRNMSKFEVSELKENFKIMKDYLATQIPSYDLEIVEINFMNIKKTLDIIHKKFIEEVELVSSWIL